MDSLAVQVQAKVTATDSVNSVIPDSVQIRLLSEGGISADTVLPIITQIHELYKSAFGTLTTTITIGLTFLGAVVAIIGIILPLISARREREVTEKVEAALEKARESEQKLQDLNNVQLELQESMRKILSDTQEERSKTLRLTRTIAELTAETIVSSGRFVSRDHLFDRAASLSRISQALRDAGFDNEADQILNFSARYFRIDLNSRLLASISATLDKEHDSFPDLINGHRNLQDFFENQIIANWRVNVSKTEISSLYQACDQELPPRVEADIQLIDHFLSTGEFLNSDGEPIVLFPNPRA